MGRFRTELIKGTTLLDDNGKTRAMLQVTKYPNAMKDIVNLLLFNEKNSSFRATITLEEDGPVLAVYDQTGILRTEVNVPTTGLGVTLFNEMGKPRAGFGGVKIRSGVTLKQGNVDTEIYMSREAPGLNLYDKDDTPCGMSDENKEGEGLVNLYKNGRRSAGFIDAEVQPGLLLFDENGRKIWPA